ncbi:glycosyltransferase WbsX family protein [Pedobacter alluvionis]|uniref:Glycosyl hydrolase n=1 Tax=Pedobacter alluvionis TaxID=475253 RepID=A0A497Y9R6_9SPHI|nr:glycoside hydrolase family 99-like domain-containing protein [Pedobacter alluvionis]RLJ77688.1 glycosyl transferase family WbsX [Pedobacter alluvionis]TFB33110.1 glycosyl hydrolase [Pedobacter alluvionis]
MKYKIKPIAIYLPQYHTIKENNEWWGDGFTEWTNVKKAQSLFKNHYQPHVPLNKNYYDLSSNDVLIEQAALAKEYGIYGFCFYHYWFNGKLLLEKPLHHLLQSSEPDFPFCLSWANENWTRRWDGDDQQVLKQQNYSLEDDFNHINYLLPFFKDQRYIKIDGKPVFLVYRSELHPDIKEATNIWRREAKKAGFPDLFLIRMENFKRQLNPSDHGFDAGMEFAPDSLLRGNKIAKKNIALYLVKKLLHKTGIKKSVHFDNGIYSYTRVVKNMINRDNPGYKYFRCICPSWDNSARRKKNATIYIDSTPELFAHWTKKMKEYTEQNLPENEKLLFINAWNEWGEGCHLEPDELWGTRYLQALKDGLNT